SISDVIDALDKDLGAHFFPTDPDEPDKNPRACPACAGGRLGLKLGRNGGFIGCSNYPDCRFTRPLAVPGDGAGAGEVELIGPRELGTDPETGEPVTLRKGPYGLYVQRGEAKDKEKPKRASVPKSLALDDVTLERALALLALPRTIGDHPESGEPLTAGIGRYGPYVKHGSTYRTIPDDEDVLTVGLNRAVALIAEAPARRGGGGGGGKEFGLHPADGKPIMLHSGRYGPYVKHGRIIASLPKNLAPEALSLDKAVELLAARAEKTKGGKKAKPAAKGRKKAKRRTGARKTTARKAAS
ncbi:MAG: topoisomerase C-terminal repeat-containing protein, partial [Kiloniellales bacterium]